jgi:toxin ParE1/3/4
MTLRIAFSRAARHDLNELVVYIGKDNPQMATQVAQRIFKKIDLLQDQPLIGRAGKRPGNRELVVDGTPYIVAYRVERERRRVFILRIVHHAQQWPQNL